MDSEERTMKALRLRGEAVKLLDAARETLRNAKKATAQAQENVDALVKVIAELDVTIGPSA